MSILHNTKGFLNRYKSLIILSFFLSALLFALPACKENSSDIINPQSGNDNVSVGFFSERQSDNNLLIITEAKFLLKNMVLEVEDGENEKDIKLGPFVVYLDLSAKVVLAAITKIDAGRYDAIKFHVHKPNPNDIISDPDFTEGTSKRFSVVVKGFYNGVPFVYKSDINVAKKIEFENNSVAISASPIIINITVLADPYSWFEENGIFIDPSMSENSHKIDHNIKQSLKRAFRDMNLDGNPD